MKLHDILESNKALPEIKARLAALKADLKEFPEHPRNQEQADAVDEIHAKIAALEKQVKQSHLDDLKDLAEGGMPSSVAALKTKLNSSTPEELHARFKEIADRTGKSIETLARETAWRHGYGKMAAHYWNKIKDLV